MCLVIETENIAAKTFLSCYGFSDLICRGTARGVGHKKRILRPHKLSRKLQQDLCQCGYHHFRAMVDLAVTLQPAREKCRRSQPFENMEHGRLQTRRACGPIGPSPSGRTCTDQACNGSETDLTTRECATEATSMAIQHESVVHQEFDTRTHFSRSSLNCPSKSSKMSINEFLLWPSLCDYISREVAGAVLTVVGALWLAWLPLSRLC